MQHETTKTTLEFETSTTFVNQVRIKNIFYITSNLCVKRILIAHSLISSFSLIHSSWQS